MPSDEHQESVKEHRRKLEARYSGNDELKRERCTDLWRDLSLQSAIRFERARDAERLRAEPPEYIQHLTETQQEQWAEWLSFPKAFRAEAQRAVEQEQRDSAKGRKRSVAVNLRQLKTEALFTNDHIAGILQIDVGTVISHTQLGSRGRCPSDELLRRYAEIYTVALKRVISVDSIIAAHEP